jgi:hypothetical protein
MSAIEAAGDTASSLGGIIGAAQSGLTNSPINHALVGAPLYHLLRWQQGLWLETPYCKV